MSSQSVSGFSSRKGLKKPETDWDDKPGMPRLVIIPVRFGVFWPANGKKTLKRTGRTSLGSPGLSSQSVSGFSGGKGLKIPKRTGMTRLWEAHPNPFGGFLAENGQNTLKRTGMTSLASPGLSSQSVLRFSGRKGLHKPKRTGMTSLGIPGLSSPFVSGLPGRKGVKKA